MPAVIELNIPTRVIFGSDIIGRVADASSKLGEKYLIAAEDNEKIKEQKIIDKLKEALESIGYGVIVYDKINPWKFSKGNFEELKNIASEAKVDVIIGVGTTYANGVSKIIASLVDKELSGLRRVPFSSYRRKRVSYIEVPLGFELMYGLTNIAFMYDNDEKTYIPYVDEGSYADYLIVDTKFLINLSPLEIGMMGISSLAIAFDAFISKASTPLSDAFAYKAMEMISLNLRRILKEPGNLTILGNLSMGGILSSLALANSKPGLCLAVGLAISALTDISPTYVTALILPHVMDFNLTAAAPKLVQVATALGEKVYEMTVIEAAIKAAETVRKLMLDMNLHQSLSKLGVNPEILDQVAKNASNYDFLAYIPRPAGRDEILAMLQAAMI